MTEFGTVTVTLFSAKRTAGPGLEAIQPDQHRDQEPAPDQGSQVRHLENGRQEHDQGERRETPGIHSA